MYSRRKKNMYTLLQYTFFTEFFIYRIFNNEKKIINLTTYFWLVGCICIDLEIRLNMNIRDVTNNDLAEYWIFGNRIVTFKKIYVLDYTYMLIIHTFKAVLLKIYQKISAEQWEFFLLNHKAILICSWNLQTLISKLFRK